MKLFKTASNSYTRNLILFDNMLMVFIAKRWQLQKCLILWYKLQLNRIRQPDAIKLGHKVPNVRHQDIMIHVKHQIFLCLLMEFLILRALRSLTAGSNRATDAHSYNYNSRSKTNWPMNRENITKAGTKNRRMNGNIALHLNGNNLKQKEPMISSVLKRSMHIIFRNKKKKSSNSK